MVTLTALKWSETAAELSSRFQIRTCPLPKTSSYDFDEIPEGTPSVVRLHLALRVLDRPLIDDLVDQAELLGHAGGHEGIALERVLDLLERLAGVLDVDFIEPLFQVQDL